MQQDEFDHVKRELSQPTILSQFDGEKSTYLYTDAVRKGGMGYILLQEDEGPRKNFLISTGSTRLSKAQNG